LVVAGKTPGTWPVTTPRLEHIEKLILSHEADDGDHQENEHLVLQDHAHGEALEGPVQEMKQSVL